MTTSHVDELFLQSLAIAIFSLRQEWNLSRSFETQTEEDRSITLSAADAQELKVFLSKTRPTGYPSRDYADAVLRAVQEWDQQPFAIRALVRQMLREYRARAALATC